MRIWVRLTLCYNRVVCDQGPQSTTTLRFELLYRCRRWIFWRAKWRWWRACYWLTAIFTRNGFQFVVKIIYCIETYDNNSWSKFKKKGQKRVSFNVWLFLGLTTFFRMCNIKSCLLFLAATIGMHCVYRFVYQICTFFPFSSKSLFLSLFYYYKSPAMCAVMYR